MKKKESTTKNQEQPAVSSKMNTVFLLLSLCVLTFVSVTQRKLQTEAPCETYKNETSCEEKKGNGCAWEGIGKICYNKTSECEKYTTENTGISW